MSMTTIETLNQIFCMVFDDGTLRITPAMTAGDVVGWDSLSHVNLITAVEAKFNIRFTLKELLKQKSVGDLIADIDRKLVA
jgi:acyl carrier protein